MSVIKNKRGISDLEFYRNAIKLRKDITLLLLRDFGIRNKVRKSTVIQGKMSDEDAATLQALIDKYEYTNVLDQYPDWLIDKMRNNILNLCYCLVMNITQANTIYPTNESEYYDRRNYQNHAIGNCEQLLQEMQYIISILPTDVNKYLPYVSMIDEEIKLLRGWRKSDNRILRKLKGNSEDDSNEKENNLDSGKQKKKPKSSKTYTNQSEKIVVTTIGKSKIIKKEKINDEK